MHETIHLTESQHGHCCQQHGNTAVRTVHFILSFYLCLSLSLFSLSFSLSLCLCFFPSLSWLLGECHSFQHVSSRICGAVMRRRHCCWKKRQMILARPWNNSWHPGIAHLEAPVSWQPITIHVLRKHFPYLWHDWLIFSEGWFSHVQAPTSQHFFGGNSWLLLWISQRQGGPVTKFGGATRRTVPIRMRVHGGSRKWLPLSLAIFGIWGTPYSTVSWFYRILLGTLFLTKMRIPPEATPFFLVQVQYRVEIT